MVAVAETLDVLFALFRKLLELLCECVFAAGRAGIMNSCNELIEVVGVGGCVEELKLRC
jgi:hypothetical protein